MALHAHVRHESADCDGRYSRNTVVSAGDMSVSEFRDFLRGIYDYEEIEDNTYDAIVIGFYTNEATEEGYRSADIEWDCHLDCEAGVVSRRDHRAESMGY